MRLFSPSWERFCSQIFRDALLWLFCMLLLGGFRFFMLFHFRGKIDPTTSWHEIMPILATGLRFDVKIATILILVPFLLSLACGLFKVDTFTNSFRCWLGTLFWIVSLIVGRIAVGFFREYNDNFNYWLFGIYYDDTTAILRTVATTYNLWLEIPILVCTAIAGFYMVRHLQFRLDVFQKFRLNTTSLPVRSIVLILIIAFLLGGIRGSVGRRPVQLKDAGVSKDEFFNKIVLNPYMAIFYAFSEQQAADKSNNLRRYLPDGDVGSALRQLTGKSLATNDIDEYFVRTAAGPAHGPPSQVFLIVMESLDSWTMTEPFNNLGLTNRLQYLAQQGALLRQFVSAADDTMSSLVTIITGYPNTGVRANYQRTAHNPYKSSLPQIFNRLGFKTRFFYGGYLSWQRIGDFCKSQGFAEVYGGPHITGGKLEKEWGVDDEVLYDFIGKKIDETPRQSGLNVIMTTSYHPPFSIDLAAKGFQPPVLSTSLAAKFDGSVSMNTLGHLWYADRSAGDFVESISKKIPDALFLITGDHYSRRYPNQHPGLYDKLSVPLLIYRPSGLHDIKFAHNAAGGHKDIVPTLVELVAPKGFVYHAPGTDLTTVVNSIGIEKFRAITADTVIDFAFGKSDRLHPYAEKSNPATIEQIRKIHDLLIGVSLYRVTKGPSF